MYFEICRKINPKKIAEFIRYTHEKARTFAVYAKQNSNLGMMGLAAVAAATTAMEESAADNDGTLAPMLGRSNKQLSAMSLANSDAAVAECMESVKEGRKKNMSKYCTKKAPGYRKPKKQT